MEHLRAFVDAAGIIYVSVRQEGAAGLRDRLEAQGFTVARTRRTLRITTAIEGQPIKEATYDMLC